MICFNCFKFDSVSIIYYTRIELDFQKRPSSDLAVSRPKKLASVAEKLVRSTCSESRIEPRTLDVNIYKVPLETTYNGQQLYAAYCRMVLIKFYITLFNREREIILTGALSARWFSDFKVVLLHV